MTDYVRVPREPTEAMIEAIGKAFGRMHGDVCYPTASEGEKAWAAAEIWSAMLAASPQGAGGWIKHDGGPNPVPGKMVSARYRHGCTTSSTVGASEAVWWDAAIAYRVTEGVKP